MDNVEEMREFDGPIGIGRAGSATFNLPYRYDYLHQMLVEIHIGWHRIRTKESKDFCAIFDFSMMDAMVPIARKGEARLTCQTYLPIDHGSMHDTQEPVLVRIVKRSQQPERSAEYWVRTVVRLSPLNSCHNGGANFPQTVTGFADNLIEFTSSIRNGELELPAESGRVGVRFMASNDIYEVIESRPEVIQKVSEHESNLLERWSLIDPKDKTVAGTFRVSLSNKAVRVTVMPRSDFSIYRLAVNLRPHQFGAHTGQV